MNKAKIEKIKKFIADKAMAEAVKGVLMESFLKVQGPRDIHVIAAERLAIDNLREGFKDLEIATKDNKKEEVKEVQEAL